METSRDPFSPPGVEWSTVSERLITARLVSLGIIFVIPVAGAVVLGVLVGRWTWLALVGLLALAGWLLWLIPRQVRAISYAEREEDLLVRRGVMFRSLHVVPYGRMQFIDVSEGPLARKLGIAEVNLNTASASTDASIPGLEKAVAARLKDRLSELGESRLAGL